MVCCWAGKDDKFNSYETARAWGIYTTLPILSLAIFYIIYYFHRTRNQFEMIKRGPPTSMILILLSVWFCVVTEAMTHLTWDLELAYKDWQLFINDEQANVSTVLEAMEDTGWAFCIAIYFFRIWMFWYKSELNKVVQPIGDNAKEKGHKVRLNIYLRKRKYFGNEKYVGVVCFLWVVIEITPVLIINVIINSGDNGMQMLRLILSSILVVPVFISMIVLTLNVKNKFGVVREYKILLLTFICTLTIRFLLLATPVADTYYRLLIGFESRTFIALLYYIWLMNFLREFDVKNFHKRRYTTLKGPKSDTFEDYTLDEVLSHRKGFALFCDHVKETLCTENLFFFLDVYKHRKSLPNDPFIDLSEGASLVVRSCAMLNMDWIDEEIIKEAAEVPSCRQIYKRYVEPSSQMEVNIPGWMRKQIVKVFEEKKEKLSFFARISQRASSAGTNNLGSTGPKKQPLYIRTRSLFTRKSGTNEYAPDKSSTRTTTAIAENAMLPLDEHLRIPSISKDISIEYLYPAWAALVNLLSNDSLVRFKMGLHSKATWRERFPDEAGSINC